MKDFEIKIELSHITRFICDTGLPYTARLNNVKCDKCKCDNWSED